MTLLNVMPRLNYIARLIFQISFKLGRKYTLSCLNCTVLTPRTQGAELPTHSVYMPGSRGRWVCVTSKYYHQSRAFVSLQFVFIPFSSILQLTKDWNVSITLNLCCLARCDTYLIQFCIRCYKQRTPHVFTCINATQREMRLHQAERVP